MPHDNPQALSYRRAHAFLVFCLTAWLLPGLAGAAGKTERISYPDTSIDQSDDSLAQTVALSADGNVAAYAGRHGRPGPWRQDIFVSDRLTREITRITTRLDGLPTQGECANPALSADGRYVAFRCHDSNMVPDDTNKADDVFVHDRYTRETRRVSVDSLGRAGNKNSDYPSLSANGRYVVFSSWADNLVPGDTNDQPDVFLHDRVTGVTTRVSVDSEGRQLEQGARNPALSADGRIVAFIAGVFLDTPARSYQLLVRNLNTGKTVIASRNSQGELSKGEGLLDTPALSADGRYIAFSSSSPNLVPDDYNGRMDVFVRDLQEGVTTRASVDSQGAESAGRCVPDGEGGWDCSGSDRPGISSDGRYVYFVSYADDLYVSEGHQPGPIYIHDRLTGETTVPDPSFQDEGRIYSSSEYAFSADQRFMAYLGWARQAGSIYLRDRERQPESRARVKVSLEEGPDPLPPGWAPSYTAVVTNNGPDSAPETLLTAWFDPPRVPTSASPDQGVCTPGVITVCRLGELAKHGESRVTFTLPRLSASTTQVTAHVSVKAAPEDPSWLNNVARETTTRLHEVPKDTATAADGPDTSPGVGKQ